MATATLSLIGLFVSLYLSLWKMGYMGQMSCGEGSCEAVQLSEYAYVLGIPVAHFGVMGYLVLLVVSLVGLQPSWISRRGPTLVLMWLAAGGVLFTAYLTYLEAFVIDAWCRWCLFSAAVIVAVFGAAVMGLKEIPSRGAP